jgi:hypothetical protein
MEWTLTGLFVLSALLLIFSLIKTYRESKAEQKRIDMVHVSVMKDINDMQSSIRNLEIDMEVIGKEAGVPLSADEKILMREVLDLYKRSYSIESIAEMKNVTVAEIKEMLAPYEKTKEERRPVAHAN